jgi:hypothetical protein
MTHQVVKDRFPATLDAELGRVPEGQSIDALTLPEKFAGCKTCGRIEAKPCFGVKTDPFDLVGVTQYLCPGWKLTAD